MPRVIFVREGIAVKHLPSALSTAALVVLATLGVPLPHAADATPTFVQGTAFSTAPTSATTVTLNRPVARDRGRRGRRGRECRPLDEGRGGVRCMWQWNPEGGEHDERSSGQSRR